MANSIPQIIILQQTYQQSKIHPTLIKMASNALLNILKGEQGFHDSKGEQVVEISGNRIALIYELKNDKMNNVITMAIKGARYTKGKSKMVKRGEKIG